MNPSEPRTEQEEKDVLKSAPLGIRADADVQRRLIHYGVRTLSDAELVGLILRSHDPERSAAMVAQEFMDMYDGTLMGLGRITMEDVCSMRGYGTYRAKVLLAALEIGRRRNEGSYPLRREIRSSVVAFEALKPLFIDLPHEEFWIMLLDRGNRLIRTERISVGGLHGTVADPKAIFNRALLLKASSLVLAHNHPSGQLRPSEEDIRLTRKLVEAGRFLDLSVNDHVIVSNEGYFSFADNGML